jgi:hypothetical protein
MEDSRLGASAGYMKRQPHWGILSNKVRHGRYSKTRSRRTDCLTLPARGRGTESPDVVDFVAARDSENLTRL